MQGSPIVVGERILFGQQHPRTFRVGLVRVVRGDVILHEHVVTVGAEVAVVDVEQSVLFIVRMEGLSEEALLLMIQFDQLGDIEERLVEKVPVLVDDQYLASALDDEDAPATVTGIGYVDRINKSVGHLDELDVDTAGQRPSRLRHRLLKRRKVRWSGLLRDHGEKPRSGANQHDERKQDKGAAALHGRPPQLWVTAGAATG